MKYGYSPGPEVAPATTKILTVIGQYYPYICGGAERVARYIVENTNCTGFRNDVLTIATSPIRCLLNDNRPPWMETISCHDGGTYRIYRATPFVYRGEDKNGRFFRYYTLGKLVWHLLRLAPRYDLIHAHSYYWPALAAVITGRLSGKPVVITGHCGLDQMLKEIERHEIPRFLLQALKYGTSYAAISRKIAADATTVAGIESDHVRLIYNGIDTAKFAPPSETEKRALRRKLNLPNDKAIIIFHGRLDVQKNLPMLLLAFARTGLTHKQLLLLLGDGEHRDPLSAMAKSLGQQDSVLFLGSRENVEDYLKAADIYCLPSHYEGFSLALLEAMATGNLCIASDIDGNREVIKHGWNGYLVNPADDDALTSCLKHAVNDVDSALSSQLRRRARETVVTQFSLERMLADYTRLYREVANRGIDP